MISHKGWILLLLLSLFACQDNITIEYSNVNDPFSSEYIPNSPQSLKLLSYTETSVELNWSDLSAGETGFVIERSEDDNNKYIPIDTVESNITNYTDLFTLKANKNYFYRVNAISKYHSSKHTNSVSVNYKLVAPTIVNFNNQMDKGCLNWNDNNENEKGYKVLVRRIGKDNDFNLYKTVGNNISFCTIDNLDTTLIYEFKVYAFTDYNNSDASKSKKIIYSILPTIKEKLSTHLNIKRIEFSPNNNSLLVPGTNKENIKIWDAEQGVIMNNINFQNEYSTFHPNGNIIAIAPTYDYQSSKQDPIYIYNIATRSIIDSVDLAGEYINYNPEGNKIIVSERTSRNEIEFVLFDLLYKKEIWREYTQRRKMGKFSHTGEKIICIQDFSPNNKILILDSKSGSTLGSIDPDGYQIYDYAISNNDKLIAFSSSAKDYYVTGTQFEIWDLESLQLVKKIDTKSLNSGIYSLDFSNDDKILAVGNEGLNIYRTNDFQLIGKVGIGGSDRITSMDFNYNGKYLAVAQQYSNTKIISFKYGWDTYYGE